MLMNAVHANTTWLWVSAARHLAVAGQFVSFWARAAWHGVLSRIRIELKLREGLMLFDAIRKRIRDLVALSCFFVFGVRPLN